MQAVDEFLMREFGFDGFAQMQSMTSEGNLGVRDFTASLVDSSG